MFKYVYLYIYIDINCLFPGHIGWLRADCTFLAVMQQIHVFIFSLPKCTLIFCTDTILGFSCGDSGTVFFELCVQKLKIQLCMKMHNIINEHTFIIISDALQTY